MDTWCRNSGTRSCEIESIIAALTGPDIKCLAVESLPVFETTNRKALRTFCCGRRSRLSKRLRNGDRETQHRSNKCKCSAHNELPEKMTPLILYRSSFPCICLRA